MRKIVIAIFLILASSVALAVDFNQFRPQGEVQTDQAVFWGEIVSERQGDAKLYINDEVVLEEHIDGREDFPAGYDAELTEGNYSWKIGFTSEGEEYFSDEISFTVQNEPELHVEYLDEGEFETASSPGEFNLVINDTLIIDEDLEEYTEEDRQFYLEEGLYSYSASLITDNGQEIILESNMAEIRYSVQPDEKNSLEALEAGLEEVEEQENQEEREDGTDSLELSRTTIIVAALSVLALVAAYLVKK